jgi:Type III restriction enzyme, res subunit
MDPAVSGDKGAWRRRSDAAVSGADPICPRSKQAMELPPDDLIVFDEAHRSRGRTREHLISFYPDAMLLGMPATPFRGDGRGLGNLFDTMVETRRSPNLSSRGILYRRGFMRRSTHTCGPTRNPAPGGAHPIPIFQAMLFGMPVCPISGNPLSRMLFSSDAVSAFSHRSSVHRQRST